MLCSFPFATTQPTHCHVRSSCALSLKRSASNFNNERRYCKCLCWLPLNDHLMGVWSFDFSVCAVLGSNMQRSIFVLLFSVKLWGGCQTGWVSNTSFFVCSSLLVMFLIVLIMSLKLLEVERDFFVSLYEAFVILLTNTWRALLIDFHFYAISNDKFNFIQQYFIKLASFKKIWKFERL